MEISTYYPNQIQNTINTQYPVNAHESYGRAYRQGKLTRLFSDPKYPIILENCYKWLGLGGEKFVGFRSMKVNHVIGTRGPCIEYDREFRPTIDGCKQMEWEYCAMAMFQEVKISPISVLQWGDPLFLLEESDRLLISVMRAIGIKEFEAKVFIPETYQVPPTTIPYLTWWAKKSEG